MSLVQSIDYAAIAPPLVIAGAALVVLVADLFVSDKWRIAAAYLSLAGAAAALGVTAWVAIGPTRRTLYFASGGCSYVTDEFTLFFQVLFLGSLLSLGVLARDFTLRPEQMALTFMSALATQAVFMQALGRYYYDNDRVYNRAPDWSLVPGVHMRVNDKCWFSLGASRFSLFTCSWHF